MVILNKMGYIFLFAEIYNDFKFQRNCKGKNTSKMYIQVKYFFVTFFKCSKEKHYWSMYIDLAI